MVERRDLKTRDLWKERQVMGAGQGPGLPASRWGAQERLQVASASWDGAAGANGHLPRVQLCGQHRSASPPTPAESATRPGTQPRTPGARRRLLALVLAGQKAGPCPQHAPTRHRAPNSGQETAQEKARQPDSPDPPTGGKRPGTRQRASGKETELAW